MGDCIVWLCSVGVAHRRYRLPSPLTLEYAVMWDGLDTNPTKVIILINSERYLLDALLVVQQQQQQ